MSILPYGPINENMRALEYARPPEVKTTPEAAVSPHSTHAVDHVKVAEEFTNFGISARARQHSTERESARPRNFDQRALARQAYRMGRLRGIYAAYDEVFWRNEVTPRAEKLLRAARRTGKVEARADAEQEDPFKRYIALLEARQLAAGDTQAGQRLEASLDQVWEQHEGAIVAGFNTMGPLLRFSRDIGEWDTFRAIYFECVIHGELAKTFRALLDRFGPARLRSAIDTLRNAIAADLASPIVCADKDRWQQEYLDLVDNRRILSLIVTAEDFCREALTRDPEAEMVMSLVGGVLDYAAGPNERKLNALCAILVPEEDVTEVWRLRLRQFMKKHVPLWLWSSAEARDLIFPAALRARV